MGKSKSQLRRIALQQGKPMPTFASPETMLAMNKLILGEKKEPEATVYGVIPVNFFFLP